MNKRLIVYKGINYNGTICMHYDFISHRCIWDDSFCTYGYPIKPTHCTNNKYKRFYLPSGISDLYDW